MNENERSELERLKERQMRLEQELALLGEQLRHLETRLRQPEPQLEPRSPARPDSAAPQPAYPQAGAPSAGAIRPQPTPTEAQRPALKPMRIEMPPPPSPPVIAPAAAPQASTPPAAAAPAPLHLAGPPAVPPVSGESPARKPGASTEAGSFEMRLGTYWLVRIGIVLVLIGLVFFGNLAYHKIISKFGPAGKVSLLYVASLALLGAGAWWQRKAAKESLKNYGQVLFAGGLAAVYFTTYAAHHLEQLRVIPSALLDGSLLLGWAGFMVWVADRKKSEVLALFSVGLAYFTSINTSIITRVDWFTLYSNLVLTGTAVLFLVRHRWAALTFASLVATYAAYAFWRFFDGSAWHWASPEQGLWTGACFLICYWIEFTAAVFLSKHEKFAGQTRASFLTLNNGAFFSLFLLTMLQVQHGQFWKFSLIYGVVLLGLAVGARRLLSAEPVAKNSYLTQGLLLVTTGFISHPDLAGLQLALVLAMESVVLLILGQQRRNLVLLTGAYVAAALAAGWGMNGLQQFDRPGVWLAIGLGALMMVNTLLAHRHTVSTSIFLRPQPSYFAVLALLVWFGATWNNVARENSPLVLAGEAAVLILSIYLLRVPEISLWGQLYLILAQLIWIYDIFGASLTLPWWNSTLLILLAVGLSHWWRRQKVLGLGLPGGSYRAVFEKLPVFGKSLVLLAGTHVAVTLAGGWGLDRIVPSDSPGIYVPVGLGALILADALLGRRQALPANGVGLRLQPTYSTVSALVIWLAVTWHCTSPENFPLVLAVEGVVLTLSVYLLQMPEITLLGQGYIVIAQAAWLGRFVVQTGHAPPWWNSLAMIAMLVGLGHWWQRQRAIELRSQFGLFCQGLYALAVIGVLYFWLGPQTQPATWLILTSLLALALTAYGAFTRSWFLAACGQIFVVISGAQFAWQLVQRRPHWLMPLAPVAALGLLSYGAVAWFKQKPDASGRVSTPVLQLALLYRWTALVMSIWWVCEYIPPRERIWLLALLGLWFFLWAGWQRDREALLFSAAFTATALTLFWLPLIQAPTVYWPNLLVIILLLGQRQIARRLPERYPLEAGVHGTVIILGGLSLWLFLSRWVLENGQPSYLTASWAALALAQFSAGIALRERMYRWLGLGILACALGRVTFVDVWRLETVFRVLSFMALGIVLLVLGFIYNKYQEKIREWL